MHRIARRILFCFPRAIRNRRRFQSVSERVSCVWSESHWISTERGKRGNVINLYLWYFFFLLLFKLIPIIIFVIRVIIINFFPIFFRLHIHHYDESIIHRFNCSTVLCDYNTYIYVHARVCIYLHTYIHVYKFRQWPNTAWSAMNSITKLYLYCNWIRFFYIGWYIQRDNRCILRLSVQN